jgi:Na+/proline symporter
MLIFLLYTLIIITITYFQRKNIGEGIFKTTKKVSWFIAGISLLMYYVSVEQGQVLTGIIEEKGIWGLWIFWPSFLGSLVVPIVLAPLWSKLDFITDNQFILFRFSGKSARILHQFRSIYVGGMVVTFLLSFHILAFSRVLETYYDFSQTNAVWLIGVVLALFALKNSFQLKIKLDGFHALLYFIGLSISFYYLYHASGGWSSSVLHFQDGNLSKTALFPPNNAQHEWGLFFVFLGIQWWSAQLFDGGGPEMARFTATKGTWNVIKASILPVILYTILSLIILSMAVMAISLQKSTASEAGFIEMIFKVVPDGLSSICLLGFFAMFISTSESLMSWGGSFLTIDFYKTYLSINRTEKHYAFISFLTMVLLTVTAVIIAQNSSSLQFLILVVFSISAGVAPVYILRWFWMRINAWSQLSAMLSSCFATLFCEFYKLQYPQSFQYTYLNPFAVQMIVVTSFTTIIWLTSTFLTKKDTKQTINKFLAILPSKQIITKQLILAFSLGLLLLLFNLGLLYCLLNFNTW